MSEPEIAPEVLARLKRHENLILSSMRRVLVDYPCDAQVVWHEKEVVCGLPSVALGHFDAILAGESPLKDLAGCLSPDGAIYFECIQPPVREAWEGAGLSLYCCWTSRDGIAGAYSPGPSLPEEVHLPCTLMLVRADYDPVLHARQLLTAGKVAAAYELLLNTPEEWLGTDEARGRLAAEKLLTLLVIDGKSEASERLNRFARGLDYFYHGTTWHPWQSPAYQSMAIFWQRIGRPDMARRVLRSYLHVKPDDAMQRMLDGMPELSVLVPDHAAPSWTDKKFRLLFVTPCRADYGADALYDGLCRVLGNANVVDWPWKATLHGGDPALAWGYPCVFNYPGAPQSLEQVCAALRGGEFDAVVFADTAKTIPQAEVVELAESGAGVPWFLLDASDFCGDYREDMEKYLGGLRFQGHFKREMLAGVAYSDGTVPMPFSYPDGLVPELALNETRSGLFWAGKFQFGGRRLTLEYLRARIGLDFLKQYPQEEYKRRIQSSLVGLCLFGSGFDTVRYWELPAHGVMLLAERPPITLPDNFVDGVEAVYFSDLAELDQCLLELLDDPDRAAQIAFNGRAKFLQCHTASARARQFLGHLEAQLSPSQEQQ